MSDALRDSFCVGAVGQSEELPVYSSSHLISVPSGAGALFGDTHTETLQTALWIGLREVEEAKLALITQRSCHVVLAVAGPTAGSDGSSVVTCGRTRNRNTFSIGLERVALVASCTLFASATSVARPTGITGRLLINIQKACV